MLGQAILAHKSPLTGYQPDVPYRYAMAMGGALMLGWTVLLLWADRKPVERRGVLLITDLVILGLIGGSLFAWCAGFLPAGAAIGMVAFQAALIVLFTACYLASRKEVPWRRLTGCVLLLLLCAHPTWSKELTRPELVAQLGHSHWVVSAASRRTAPTS